MRKSTPIGSAWVRNLVLSPDPGINDKHAILASLRAEQRLALVALTQLHISAQV
jgi:hypothetical protein